MSGSMQRFIPSLLFFFASVAVFGQITDSLLLGNPITLASVYVSANWANVYTPIAQSNLTASQFKAANLGQDIPYLLRLSPSVVETSDAGAGIGYTGIRIRGSDATAINVTLNGVPLNDAESQGVFWVNLPDFASNAAVIQVQRGIGTSTNGAGAFGGSINISTAKIIPEPYAELSQSVGSFGTLRSTIKVGTGIIDHKFSLDARLSRIVSDGYIDRASSNLRAYFLSAVYLGHRQSLRLNVFGGNEQTYQSWYGLPAQYIEVDSLRRFNPAGTERPNEPYQNQIDNYTQSHYQAVYQNDLSRHLRISATAHYTRGFGYYEEYKAAQSLSNYGIKTDSSTQNSDLVRQRWLDNHFYGSIVTANYHLHPNQPERFELTLSGAWNRYIGQHFGEVIWARNAGDSELGHRYYDNSATKTDYNTYAKLQSLVSKKANLYGYVDVQFRQVAYQFVGKNNDASDLNQQVQLPFFNPKAGLWTQRGQHRAYLSVALAHREPNRDDYTESSPKSRPKAEQLINTELGYQLIGKNLQIGANFYHMSYRNQLALTGLLNDVGGATRINLPKSSRTGIELEAAYSPTKRLRTNANTTLSHNNIPIFEEYIDNWDTGTQTLVTHTNTPIAYSPAVIAASQIEYDLMLPNSNKNRYSTLTGVLLGKYVGKQYVDNTNNDAASLPQYYTIDARLQYLLKPQNTWCKELAITLQISNLTNYSYSSNAWVYRFQSANYDPRPDDASARIENGDTYHLMGYFPQARRHLLVGATITF